MKRIVGEVLKLDNESEGKQVKTQQELFTYLVMFISPFRDHINQGNRFKKESAVFIDMIH